MSADLSAVERAAEILDAHGPEVTSYDGYDLTGCRNRDCDAWRPSLDGDAWVEHARHQADALAAEGLLTVREQVAREIEAAAQIPGVSGPERYALSIAAHIARGGAS